MTITQNIAVKGQHNKPIVTDLFFKQNTDKKLEYNIDKHLFL